MTTIPDGSGAEPIGTFDFEAHRRSAIEDFQRVRPLYEAFARVVEDILDRTLEVANIKAASIESRAKSLESFANKAIQGSEVAPETPKYSEPLRQITDLAAARVITFFLDTISDVDRIIAREFDVLERLDKSHLLVQEERLGYQSVHYIVQLKGNRTALPEYSRYVGLRAEIQLRTVLQHAWAEIEHDIQYKSVETIPIEVRRRFMALAGLLEIADREFQAVQKEDERLRVQARASVAAGQLADVEITGDALKAYLDKKLGSDGRMVPWAYESTARALRQLGFTNFQQVDRAIAPYNDDQLSRAVWGSRMGQLTRFEAMVHAAIGEAFPSAYPNFMHEEWWQKSMAERLSRIRAAGVPISHFSFSTPPMSDEGPSQMSAPAS